MMLMDSTAIRPPADAFEGVALPKKERETLAQYRQALKFQISTKPCEV